MSTTQVRYRIETYIVPEVKSLPTQYAINEIDDAKIANQLKVKDEIILRNNRKNEDNASALLHNQRIDATTYIDSPKGGPLDTNQTGCRPLNAKVIENLIKKAGAIFDNDNIRRNNRENFHYSHNRLKVQKPELQTSIKTQDILYPAKQFKKTTSLMSIDERSESSETKLKDLCHHGYKNGCTAAITSPEEVSEEVFKENWLQKIEILRQRETVLNEKERNLQYRERELFKREREIRIAERIVKDKLRQVELQMKHQKDMQSKEKQEEAERILEAISSNKLQESHEFAQLDMPKNSQSSFIDPCEKNKEMNRKTKNLARTKSYSSSKQPCSSNMTSEVISYSSMRYKQRPKISYDDLNSTLSADIGDSSFIRTSEKFNPEIYKKPYAFTRSASERWIRPKDDTICIRSQNVPDVEEMSHYIVEEEKVLKKLSENISASQDKNTKFQNYGLVDCKNVTPVQGKTECNSGKEQQFSYLNLEIGHELKHRKKSVHNLKERPSSWNEETNEWLQKKRQAYNLATKRSAVDKENLKCNNIPKKTEKTKNDVKSKILTIFR